MTTVAEDVGLRADVARGLNILLGLDPLAYIPFAGEYHGRDCKPDLFGRVQQAVNDRLPEGYRYGPLKSDPSVIWVYRIDREVAT